MPLYRDEAVVLRVHKLGEADRIITLLTRRHGRVRAVGKGVRRTTSKFGARLEPGSHIDVQLYTRLPPEQRAPGGERGLDIVQQTESIGAYGAQVANDYPRWTAVRRSARPPNGSPTRASRRCACTCSSSARCVRSPCASTIPASSSTRSSSAARRCRVGAGADRMREMFGARPARGLQCRRRGSRVRRLPPGRLGPPPARDDRRCSRHCSAATGRAPISRAVSARREASGLIAAHLQWHLERGLRSLPLVDRA